MGFPVKKTQKMVDWRSGDDVMARRRWRLPTSSVEGPEARRRVARSGRQVGLSLFSAPCMLAAAVTDCRPPVVQDTGRAAHRVLRPTRRACRVMLLRRWVWFALGGEP
ncbi:hypothetical protein GUJ93_ZPchr0002g25194 [Zizania palustris]|uniref:Uncharacterized protein n=1 Tax=Zizania palustris TaxID=103762 RepID=A0A8J5VBI8_ZIZPA|nr:hypothetical protein GUJ93_ZPchr0002g25194 [Zizania palustris]